MGSEWFAGRLRELREAKGWTRNQLAEAAGMAMDGIAHLELGRRKPTWDSVLALAEALGVDCTVFTQPPADREPSGRGRPAKPKDEPAGAKTPKKRGRPKKGN
jgi:transcriptional regulator with XRE-family HTH domain